jgi:hypothetical protein
VLGKVAVTRLYNDSGNKSVFCAVCAASNERVFAAEIRLVQRSIESRTTETELEN